MVKYAKRRVKMGFYKDDLTDFIMFHNTSLTRYRRLAITALKHYLGDVYDPKTLDVDVELFFRDFFNNCVEYKVFHKAPYDWIFIDNVLKCRLIDAGFENFSYDQAVLDRGYHFRKYALEKIHRA